MTGWDVAALAGLWLAANYLAGLVDGLGRRHGRAVRRRRGRR